jgi:hypothetical protein
MPMLWLAVTAAAAVGAYLVAWPAWQSSRARDARDTNSERYLAWRGRAPRGDRVREGMTGEERRRLVIGAVLGAAALAALVLFFVTS